MSVTAPFVPCSGRRDRIGGPRSIEPLIQAPADNDPEAQIPAADGLVNFYLPGFVSTGLSATLQRGDTALGSRFTHANDLVTMMPPPRRCAPGKASRNQRSLRSNAGRQQA